jgi:hypothetical protein
MRKKDDYNLPLAGVGWEESISSQVLFFEESCDSYRS